MDFGLAKRLVDTPVPTDDRTMGTEPATARSGVSERPTTWRRSRCRDEPWTDDRTCSRSASCCARCSFAASVPQGQLSRDHGGDPPRAAGSLAGGLSPGLMMLIRRLLAKRPADRYQRIGDVRRGPGAFGWLRRWPRDVSPATRRLPLIGRDSERAELVPRWAEALAGSGSFVMMGGEPGIGKTQLTTAILDEGRRRGCSASPVTVTRAKARRPICRSSKCWNTRAPGHAARPHSAQALGDAASEVAGLMPELRTRYADIPPSIQLPPEQQRRYLFNAYRGLRGAVGAARPDCRGVRGPALGGRADAATAGASWHRPSPLCRCS